MSKSDDSAKRKGVRITKGKTPKLTVAASANQVVVPLIRGQGKSADGLTAKQAAFAEHVAGGATLAASYRAAYDAGGMSAAAIHNEASRLMCHPGVAQSVNALVRLRQAKAQHDAARIKAHVTERLLTESTDPDNTPAARIRALELLGRLGLVQAFTPDASQDDTAPAQADLAATLEARLRAVMGKAG